MDRTALKLFPGDMQDRSYQILDGHGHCPGESAWSVKDVPSCGRKESPNDFPFSTKSGLNLLNSRNVRTRPSKWTSTELNVPFGGGV